MAKRKYNKNNIELTQAVWRLGVKKSYSVNAMIRHRLIKRSRDPAYDYSLSKKGVGLLRHLTR